MRKFLTIAAAGAALLGSTAAAAQDSCWSAKELDAARVRDLQSVLMVGALQCRASGHDVLARYNKFVVAGRSSLVSHNDVLKARFTRLDGPRDGQRNYDRFTTALANGHSAHAGGGDFCAAMADLASDAAEAARRSPQAVVLVAQRLSDRPMGVDSTCRSSAADK